MRTSRSLIAGALSLATLAVAPTAAWAAPVQTATPPPAHESHQFSRSSLASMAGELGLTFGVAVNTDELENDRKYRHLATTQFSSVTAENVMKWGPMEPVRGEIDYGPAEALIASAVENDQLVRGHTLVWHSQTPAWLSPDGTETTLTPQQVRDAMQKRVTETATHFKGQIWQWDVVNEAFNEDGTYRRTVFYNAYEALGLPGHQYIADAFRWAHAADPDALLFYNDYNLEFTSPKVLAAEAMVKELLAQDVPIHGVGLQGHLATQYGFPNLQENLQRFADLGLEVALTEVDIRTFVQPDGNGGFTHEVLTPELQATTEAFWRGTLEACLAVEACNSYTVWGVGDANSWVPGVFPGEGSALLWDERLNKKAQFHELRDVLRDAIRQQ
ncbi:endo-1,4-beta-xylanase [Cellulomonas aerilata]|uniref:Beta-xylanase n=1 Tax=Cellulomonas aerilata TaxID=515326 RepID=A0A512DDK4_9CELL|nr:endo-1,4-beta-xylanase [Cellulomonas aerilata]GEO34300.1 beta-xylanase [Cellulomonas aerilata]